MSVAGDLRRVARLAATVRRAADGPDLSRLNADQLERWNKRERACADIAASYDDPAGPFAALLAGMSPFPPVPRDIAVRLSFIDRIQITGDEPVTTVADKYRQLCEMDR